MPRASPGKHPVPHLGSAQGKHLGSTHGLFTGCALPGCAEALPGGAPGVAAPWDAPGAPHRLHLARCILGWCRGKFPGRYLGASQDQVFWGLPGKCMPEWDHPQMFPGEHHSTCPTPGCTWDHHSFRHSVARAHSCFAGCCTSSAPKELRCSKCTRCAHGECLQARPTDVLTGQLLCGHCWAELILAPGVTPEQQLQTELDAYRLIIFDLRSGGKSTSQAISALISKVKVYEENHHRHGTLASTEAFSTFLLWLCMDKQIPASLPNIMFAATALEDGNNRDWLKALVVRSVLQRAVSGHLGRDTIRLLRYC